MPEQLGEAVLILRTDDSALDPGMNKARAGAVALSGTFDKTSASSGRLTQNLATTGKAAAATGVQFTQAGRQVVAASAGQRAGVLNLTRQVGDLSTMFALNAPLSVIFASQISQIADASQQAFGGASKFARFLGGPWGIAIMIAVQALGPFVGKLFEAEKAAELAEAGADALGRAQSALGQIFDQTSGKLRTQNELLIVNARLMAANLRAEALSKRASAKETLIDAQRAGAGSVADPRTWVGLASPTGISNARAVRRLLGDIGSGKVSRADAIARAEDMDFTGTGASRTEFMEALRDATVANLNERVAEMIDQSLDSGQLAEGLRDPGKDKKSGRSKRDTGPTAEDIQRRFDDELIGYTQQSLSAMQQVATSAEERAELELRSVEWSRRQTLAEIEADEDYSESQKRELAAQVERLADHERAAIEFRKRQRIEQEAQQLADEQFRAQSEALQAQIQLAETDEERKRIALQIFDVEQAYLESRLEALAASETATEAEKERARLALEALKASAGDRRSVVSRANETEVERYLRGVNLTGEQIGEQVDRVKMDGLDALNEGLVDAITGARTLGEVFHDTASQILADLLRISIQQSIIRPLANALFAGATGAPVDLLGGSPFGFADGGRVRGPGTGTSDSIPAWLSNGEYVLNSRAVSRIGAGTLDRWNRGEAPGFFLGGLVGKFLSPFGLLGTLLGVPSVNKLAGKGPGAAGILGRAFDRGDKSASFGEVDLRLAEPLTAASRSVAERPDASRGFDRYAGPSIGHITVNVPARADPRRTVSSVSRGTQQGLARATGKGIASPAGMGRS